MLNIRWKYRKKSIIHSKEAHRLTRKPMCSSIEKIFVKNMSSSQNARVNIESTKDQSTAAGRVNCPDSIQPSSEVERLIANACKKYTFLDLNNASMRSNNSYQESTHSTNMDLSTNEGMTQMNLANRKRKCSYDKCLDPSDISAQVRDVIRNVPFNVVNSGMSSQNMNTSNGNNIVEIDGQQSFISKQPRIILINLNDLINSSIVQNNTVTSANGRQPGTSDRRFVHIQPGYTNIQQVTGFSGLQTGSLNVPIGNTNRPSKLHPNCTRTFRDLSTIQSDTSSQNNLTYWKQNIPGELNYHNSLAAPNDTRNISGSDSRLLTSANNGILLNPNGQYPPQNIRIRNAPSVTSQSQQNTVPSFHNFGRFDQIVSNVSTTNGKCKTFKLNNHTGLGTSSNNTVSNGNYTCTSGDSVYKKKTNNATSYGRPVESLLEEHRSLVKEVSSCTPNFDVDDSTSNQFLGKQVNSDPMEGKQNIKKLVDRINQQSTELRNEISELEKEKKKERKTHVLSIQRLYKLRKTIRKRRETESNLLLVNSTTVSYEELRRQVLSAKIGELERNATRVYGDIMRVEKQLLLEKTWRKLQMCASCGKFGLHMVCKKCKSTFYCNERCQRNDWDERHSGTCCKMHRRNKD